VTLALRIRQGCDKRFERRKRASRLISYRSLRQHLRRRLVQGDTARPAVAIHADAPGDCVNPWQDWLAGPVGMPHTMNPQPGVLQQVIRLLAA
jgi:hypothetical protein